MISMANKLQNGFNKLGVSCRDVSRRFAVSEHTVENWLRGRQSPPQYVLSELRRDLALGRKL